MSIEQIQATRSFLREFIEAVPGAVYAKDREGRILLGNAGFAEAVGWPSGGFLGKVDLELLPDKDLALAVMEKRSADHGRAHLMPVRGETAGIRRHPELLAVDEGPLYR